MKKLRLEIDQLEIESFDLPEDGSAARGTVRGQQTLPQPCYRSEVGECVPSYEAVCEWTGDPYMDCFAPTGVVPCTDYHCV
jgi:hypothetical protein